MTLFQTIILGIVEGITEFLPISSTGHMMLTSSLLKIPPSEFLKTFEISIQLGAIASVLVLYWKSLVLNREMIKKVAVAFLPTAVIGFALYKFIKAFLLSNNNVVVWSLLLGGIFIIGFEKWYQRNTPKEASAVITYKQAFLIGIIQAIAVIPGVSRSAATILGGLSLGINRKTIVEFSFLLAVPTMAAAVGLDLLKSADLFTPSQAGSLAVGFVVSFVSAMLAIKFLLSFIKDHNFIPFGIYRILLAIFFLVK
jgi:undecaprenyl-diphosphatase